MGKYKFNTDHVPLSTVLNDEQLLELALYNIAYSPKNEAFDFAERVVVRYILNNLIKKDIKSFDDDEICNEFSKLVSNFILNSLTKKGLLDCNIDESGDFIFTLTEEGKKHV